MTGVLKSLTVKNWLTFVTSVLECLCFAGAVFGWASLAFVLKTEGFFSSLCVNTTVNATQVLDCSVQDEQFSLVFTIGSCSFNFLTLPCGFLFDRFGTTVARLFGIFLYTTGTLIFAFSTAALSNLLFPALSLVAVGGSLLLMTNVQVGNLFGPRRSTIISLHIGAISSSALVFLVIKLVHEAGISLLASFLFLSACSVFHLLRTFFLLPRYRIPNPLPDDYTYGVTCGKSRTVSLEHLTANGNTEMTTEEVKDVPVKQVSRYINAFAIAQLFGVLCAPLNGVIMDRNKGKPRAAGESERDADLRASVLSLFLTALLCVSFSSCACVPNLPLQYFTFVLQIFHRSFLFGGNAAFISMAFPPCHFGKVFGLVLSLAALFSLLQYGCFALVNEPLNVDPLYVNIGLTLLILLAFIHPLSVFLHCRRLASQRAINASS